MANFQGAIITTNGLNMITESQGSGNTLYFTHIKVGDGDLTAEDDIKQMLDLKHTLLSVPVTSYENLGNGKALVTANVTSSLVNQGFYNKEIGLFGKINSDGAEQLYAYSHAGNYADYMPDKTAPINEIEIRMIVAASTDSNANIKIINGDTTHVLTINDQTPDSEGNIKINIPTKVSDLTNDSGYLTTANIPTKVSDLLNDSKFADETFVNNKVAGVVNSAPSTLDTLNELATALGDDPNFATTMATELGKKVNTADLPTVAKTGAYNDLTGKPTIPTMPTKVSQLTNDTGFITKSSDITGTAQYATNAARDINGTDLTPTIGTMRMGAGHKPSLLEAAAIPSEYNNQTEFLDQSLATYEISKDGGSTWETLDMPTETHKNIWGGTIDNGYTVYKFDQGTNYKTVSAADLTAADLWQFRINITTQTTEVYNTDMLYMFLKDSAGQDFYTIRIERIKGTDGSSWETLYEGTNIRFGWGTHLCLKFPPMDIGRKYTSLYDRIRITFFVNKIVSTATENGITYPAVIKYTISKLAFYGDSYKNKYIYSVDGDKNVTFPADVLKNSKPLANVPTIINIILPVSGWSSGTYTYNNGAIKADSIITLAPQTGITAEQYNTMTAAQIISSSQTDGSIVVKALGTVPTIDIPVTWIIQGVS
jgi:hypothetical protein